LIRPATEGVENVLNAVIKYKVKKVVLTSSVASVYAGQNTKDKIFSEEDWTILDDPRYKIDPYYKSKTLAEKLAW
jgi:dihydroflavonol-4-reductase